MQNKKIRSLICPVCRRLLGIEKWKPKDPTISCFYCYECRKLWIVDNDPKRIEEKHQLILKQIENTK